MCLTLANATDVRDHQDNPPPNRGYTRTHHHAGYLQPGDLWRPDGERSTEQRPHTVMAVSHGAGKVILTDQFGVSFCYAEDAIIPTVVVDAWSFPRMRQWNQVPEKYIEGNASGRTTPIQAQAVDALRWRDGARSSSVKPPHTPDVSPEARA